jgi:hypothetical protein
MENDTCRFALQPLYHHPPRAAQNYPIAALPVKTAN